MQIKRFELHFFKPLLHANIKHIVITDISQLTLILGDNGLGKSTILREISPYPATSTIYEKGGSKEIEFTHDGSHYILISSFVNKINHSFIKDGIELNKSGTSDTQIDLVKHNLGYTKLIDDILSGDYQICNIGKQERKQLILSTYPSDLTFVLDKHKKILNIIKGINSNLKMLKERELKLKEGLLPKDQLSQYNNFRDMLNEANVHLDQDLYIINTEIKRLNNLTRQFTTYSLDDILMQLDDLVVRVNKLKEQYYKFPEDVDNTLGQLESLNKSLSDSKTNYETDALNMVSELEECKKTLSSTSESVQQECEQMIDVQNDILANNEYSTDIPILSDTDLTQLTNMFEKIKEDIIYLSSSGITHHWTMDVYEKIKYKISIQEHNLASLRTEIESVKEKLHSEKKRLKETTNNSYPSTCKVSCDLRESVESVQNSIMLEINNLTQKHNKLEEDFKTYESKLNRLKNTCLGHSPEESILRRFERLFVKHTWAFYALSNLDYKTAINKPLTNIINNINKMIVNTERHKRYKEAKDTLTVLEAKLNTIKTVGNQARDFLKKSVIDKEVKLQNLSIKIMNISKEISSVSNNLVMSKEYKDITDWFKIYDSRIRVALKSYIYEEHIKYLTFCMNELVSSKNKVSQKLREMDDLLKLQNDNTLILNSEIEPNIKELEIKLRKLNIIEKKLSPSCGIPHVYAVRYMNSLVQLANEYINKVWSYDMELAVVDEDEDLDFGFRLILYKNSEVKDINLCSTGQKSMINLAFRLAICVYNNYTLKYPIKLDEIDEGLSMEHRSKLTEFLVDILHQKTLKQVFLINHYMALHSGFQDAGIVALSGNDMLPATANIKSKVN